MSSIIYALYGFGVFFFVFWCGKWLIHILAISYGSIKLHRKINEPPREIPLPGISILKPLMGIDPNLQQNLETFFTMTYPEFELLFCIEDPDDPAVAVVQALMIQYPNIDTHLFLGGTKVGVNPKINNMHRAYELAKYNIIMISDSGIRMKPDTLLDMVLHMTDKIGLVHQMPFTCDREGFAATFEKIFFGTVQARIYLSADLLGINCHTGMSCLIRKSILDELGGIRVFGCYLAEDFFIAKAVTDAGWKMCISSQPAWQNSGICNVSNFQERLTRWAKLRVAMVPTMILLEPLSECMIVGACASWAVSFLFHFDALVFYLVHILLWFLSDWILLSIVQNGSLPFDKFDFVVGWLLREFSGPYLFLHALWSPSIRWRSRVYKLSWGGIAHELPSATIQSNPTSSLLLPSVLSMYSPTKLPTSQIILSQSDELCHQLLPQMTTTTTMTTTTEAAAAATTTTPLHTITVQTSNSPTLSSSTSDPPLTLSSSSSPSSSSSSSLASTIMLIPTTSTPPTPSSSISSTQQITTAAPSTSITVISGVFTSTLTSTIPVTITNVMSNPLSSNHGT